MSGGGENPRLYAPAFQFGAASLAPPHQPQLAPWFNAAPPFPAPPFRAAPPHLVPPHQHHHQRANGGAFNYPHLQQQPFYQQQLQLPLQQQQLQLPLQQQLFQPLQQQLFQPLQQQPLQPLQQQPLRPLQQQSFRPLQQQSFQVQPLLQQPLQPSQQQPRVANFCSKTSLPYAPPRPLQQSYTPLPKKRHLEDGDFPDLKRSKVTMQVGYIPVMDFLDKNPPIEPYQFRVGSTFGNIPEHQEGVKITEIRATVLDGYVELLGDTHNMDKSFGGAFDESDLLVSEDRPWSVTINKVPKFEASWENRAKDYNKLVTSLVMKKYTANGKKLAYADEFISRIKKLRNLRIPRREINLWIIRNHPLFIESAKRRLFLEDFYKFYKTFSPKERHHLIMMINRSIYLRWHLLIAPKDGFISFVYWKGREKMCPADHFEKDHSKPEPEDEYVKCYPFTSADWYLAAFLRHLIVHGPEDAAAVIFEDVELEELDLIIAYYFERFLPSFLEEIFSIKEQYQMIKEILTTYAYRRSVSRGWLPI